MHIIGLYMIIVGYYCVSIGVTYPTVRAYFALPYYHFVSNIN